jgi:hypothetical protein
MEKHRFEPPIERLRHLRDDEITSGGIGDASPENTPRICIGTKLVLQWMAKDGTPGRTADVQLVAQMGQEEEGYKPVTSGTKLYRLLISPTLKLGDVIQIQDMHIKLARIIAEEEQQE